MRPIDFFDDPLDTGREPEDVRLNALGLYVHEGGRRVAIGFDITPFRKRPSIEVTVTNARGERAGSLTIIEALQPNFHLTMHLRDQDPTDLYNVDVVLYYGGGADERQVVDRRHGTIDVTQPGDQTLWEET